MLRAIMKDRGRPTCEGVQNMNVVRLDPQGTALYILGFAVASGPDPNMAARRRFQFPAPFFVLAEGRRRKTCGGRALHGPSDA